MAKKEFEKLTLPQQMYLKELYFEETFSKTMFIPTATYKALHKRGYICEIVNKYNERCYQLTILGATIIHEVYVTRLETFRYSPSIIHPMEIVRDRESIQLWQTISKEEALTAELNQKTRKKEKLRHRYQKHIQ